MKYKGHHIILDMDKDKRRWYIYDNNQKLVGKADTSRIAKILVSMRIG